VYDKVFYSIAAREIVLEWDKTACRFVFSYWTWTWTWTCLFWRGLGLGLGLARLRWTWTWTWLLLDLLQVWRQGIENRRFLTNRSPYTVLMIQKADSTSTVAYTVFWPPGNYDAVTFCLVAFGPKSASWVKAYSAELGARDHLLDNNKRKTYSN